MLGNPWVYSHGTRTHECGYGFYAGTGTGGPRFTHGLPVTNTQSWSLGGGILALHPLPHLKSELEGDK